MKLTVIISYYKAISNLRLILTALNIQSCKDFEVIISEDDFNEETKLFIKDNSHLYSFSIVHINQEVDNGFRKNMMLNKSIRLADSEFLVFLDGDCIPHQHFVKEYQKNLKEGYIFFGRRVFLGKNMSTKIKQPNNKMKLSFLSILFSDSKRLKEGIYNPSFSLTNSKKNKGLVGCNWGISKQHLVEINGFDEDYILAGTGEDTDVEWRLRANGLQMKSMKNKAIVYHLNHKSSRSVELVRINHKLLADKIEANKISCLNGLEKHESC